MYDLSLNTFEKILLANKIGRCVKKIAIIDPKYKSPIVLYKSFPAAFIHSLSDIYPRIVQHYPVASFGKVPFIPDFINVNDNEVAALVKERAIFARFDA